MCENPVLCTLSSSMVRHVLEKTFQGKMLSMLHALTNFRQDTIDWCLWRKNICPVKGLSENFQDFSGILQYFLLVSIIYYTRKCMKTLPL